MIVLMLHRADLELPAFKRLIKKNLQYLFSIVFALTYSNFQLIVISNSRFALVLLYFAL